MNEPVPRTSSTLAIVLVACAIGAKVAAAQDKPTVASKAPAALPVGKPPSHLWRPEAGGMRYGLPYADAIFRDVYCHTDEKTIVSEWRRSGRTSTTERFATDYWPTLVRIMGDGNFFVTGKSMDGATILERWIFTNVTSTGARAPSVDAATECVDGSERMRDEWNLPTRSVDRVLRLEPDAPQGLIRAVFQNGKSRDKVFVYYDGSRELYAVDVSDRSQTLVAGPADSAPMQIAALTGDYRRFFEADHDKRGFCYFFGPEMGVITSLPMPQLLVLIDSDRDGKLDRWQIVSPKAWSEDGWGDIANLRARDH